MCVCPRNDMFVLANRLVGTHPDPRSLGFERNSITLDSIDIRYMMALKSIITASCCLPDTISLSESRQPLINHLPTPSDTTSYNNTNNNRKRRTSPKSTAPATPNTINHQTKPYDIPNRPAKLRFLHEKTPPRGRVYHQPSPGSDYGATYIQQWLESSPDPRSLQSPKPDDLASNDLGLKKFVMIQVFQRETLLKNDLIPLSDGDNVEICISYQRHNQEHPATNDFRTFQISPADSQNYDEFPRHLGKGIRLFCNQGKMVYLKKSTTLLTFYGTRTTSAWQELKDQEKWKPIFDFQNFEGDRDRDFKDYNQTTACVDNVVRATVGCEPNSKHIYETDFHIKLSFVVH